MLESFDGTGTRVLVAGSEQARRLRHRHLGTEHLLLGMAGLAEDRPARALVALGVRLDHIRDEILDIVPPRDAPTVADGHLPFTPRVLRVLELADAERNRLHAARVSSSHLLLALLREGNGVAGQVLRRLLSRHGAGIADVERALTEQT